MRRTLILAVFAILALTSCTSYPVIYNEAGHSYTLSRDDVAQINTLIAERRDIRKPLGIVWMKSPTVADVDTGNVWEPFGEVTRFTMRKKGGRWIIDESSVRQDRAIVTS